MIDENKLNIMLNKSINNYIESQEKYERIQLFVPKELKKDLQVLIEEFSKNHNGCIIM